MTASSKARAKETSGGGELEAHLTGVHGGNRAHGEALGGGGGEKLEGENGGTLAPGANAVLLIKGASSGHAVELPAAVAPPTSKSREGEREPRCKGVAPAPVPLRSTGWAGLDQAQLGQAAAAERKGGQALLSI